MGYGLAALLILAWVLTLVVGLRAPLSLPVLLLLIALRTFLSTGLFITAHDAMHGLVDASRPRLNHAVGALAVLLYAGFRYGPLRQAHLRHHDAPGTAEDPDFHTGDPRPLAWFVAFFRRYTTLGQLLLLAAFVQVAIHGLEVPVARLLLVWAIPALLSAIQLWYFGTWRPHHPRPEGFADEHRAAGEGWPVWATFLSCYHFGLHHTHHLAPWVPWWRLPAASRAVRLASARRPAGWGRAARRGRRAPGAARRNDR